MMMVMMNINNWFLRRFVRDLLLLLLLLLLLCRDSKHRAADLRELLRGEVDHGPRDLVVLQRERERERAREREREIHIVTYVVVIS